MTLDDLRREHERQIGADVRGWPAEHAEAERLRREHGQWAERLYREALCGMFPTPEMVAARIRREAERARKLVGFPLECAPVLALEPDPEPEDYDW